MQLTLFNRIMTFPNTVCYNDQPGSMSVHARQNWSLVLGYYKSIRIKML